MIKTARKTIRTRNPKAFKPKIKEQGPHKLFKDTSVNAAGHFGNIADSGEKEKKPTVLVKQGSQKAATRQSNITAWHINGCKCKKSFC